MNKLNIKITICILTLIILTSCNNNSIIKSDEKLTENNLNITKISDATEIEKIVNTIAETSTYVESETNLDLSLYNINTKEYINDLISNETFQSLYNIYEYAQVIDLNNDLIPEIIIQCNPYSEYETHYCYVFSKYENSVVAILSNDYEYSYYGSVVTAYVDKNGDNVFLSDSLLGGVGTGEFGKKTIEYDGKSINTKNIIRYNWEGYDNSIQYQYFDDEFTTENNNIEYNKYISSLTESKQYSGTAKLQDESCIQYKILKTYISIADLLDEFYKNIDISQ